MEERPFQFHPMKNFRFFRPLPYLMSLAVSPFGRFRWWVGSRMFPTEWTSFDLAVPNEDDFRTLRDPVVVDTNTSGRPAVAAHLMANSGVGNVGPPLRWWANPTPTEMTNYSRRWLLDSHSPVRSLSSSHQGESGGILAASRPA